MDSGVVHSYCQNEEGLSLQDNRDSCDLSLGVGPTEPSFKKNKKN